MGEAGRFDAKLGLWYKVATGLGILCFLCSIGSDPRLSEDEKEGEEEEEPGGEKEMVVRRRFGVDRGLQRARRSCFGCISGCWMLVRE